MATKKSNGFPSFRIDNSRYLKTQTKEKYIYRVER